jgi:hypothetical protein
MELKSPNSINQTVVNTVYLQDNGKNTVAYFASSSLTLSQID